MRRIVGVVLAGIVLIVIAGWMLVSAPFLGSWRAGLVQGWLDKAGAGVTLSGPVSIGLGKVVHVTAEGIGFGTGESGIALAKVEADLSLSDLMNRKVDPANIVISGASLTL